MDGETIACNYPDFHDYFWFFLALAGITTVKQIGSSFHDEPLSQFGFWADWQVEPKWNLCDAPGTDTIMQVPNPNEKTILHIPNVNSRESTKDKIREVEHIIEELGEWQGTDPKMGFQLVKSRMER